MIVNEIYLTQMLENKETHSELIEYTFSYDLTGNSIEDFSISLKIASSNLTTITMLLVLGQAAAVLSSIIIIFHRNSKADRKLKAHNS